MEKQTEASLRHLGLTEYETKTYLTLLKFGVLSADKVSEHAEIPLPRVYDTILELHKKGFVLVNMGRPKKYKAIEPKNAFANFIEIKRKENDQFIKEIKSRSDDIAKNLSSMRRQKLDVKEVSIRDEMWSAKSRRNIVSFFQDIEKFANKEILIFSGDISWIHERKDTIRSLVNRGVKIRVLVKDPRGNKRVVKNIKAAKSLGANIKSGYPGNIRAHIVDGKRAAVINKISKDKETQADTGVAGSDIDFRYELFTIETPALVNALKENFEFWWEKLK